ncbi:DUF6124 family protein [Pseudomonas sp. LB3P31]
MFKVTPNPPDADAATLSDNPDSNLSPGTVKQTASFAEIRATPRNLCTLFTVSPELDIEALLTYACETLASANVMANDLVDHMEGTSRNSLLGIAQVIMLGELAVNRALDQLEVPG